MLHGAAALVDSYFSHSSLVSVFFSWRRGSLIVFSCYSANLVFVSTGEPTLLILLGVFF